MAPTPDRPSDDEAGRRRTDPARDDPASSPAPEPPAADGRGSPEPRAGDGSPVRTTPLTQHLGRIVLVLLAVVFGVFAVANSQRVDFSWLVGETQVVETTDGASGGVPLIVLMVASFALGALLGALFEWQVLRKRTRHERTDGRRGRKGR
jgi:uncharacterized integral membrane protein